MNDSTSLSGGQRRRLSRAAWLAGAALRRRRQRHASRRGPGAGGSRTLRADATQPGDGEPLEEVIVVTARNRAERLEDVPIPISVLGEATLAEQHVFTIADITQRAPGLTATTPNARRTGVSLRGIGKTSGNDNMEAAVGVIVDDVFLDHVGMTYQDFTDLQQVEILRGPQGTLLGKNTSVGVIKYTSKLPSFTSEGIVRGRGRARERGVEGARLVLRRADRRPAGVPRLVLHRQAAGRHPQRQPGGRRALARAGPLGRARAAAARAERHLLAQAQPRLRRDRREQQHQAVHGRSDDADRRLGADDDLLHPARAQLFRRIHADHRLVGHDRHRRGAAAGHPQLRRLAGGDVGRRRRSRSSRSPPARWFHFDATNDQEQTSFPISRSGSLVDTEQFSQELRFTGDVTDTIDYQAGLYFLRIETDTNGRSRFGRDAGAFFATNAQYAALNNPAGWLLLQRLARGHAPASATSTRSRPARRRSPRPTGRSPTARR